MATVTKTYTDNEYASSSYRKTWTVNYAFSDITVSGSTFSFVTPTITAKFVGTTHIYRYTFIECSYNYFKIGGKSVGSGVWVWETPSSYSYTKGSSGATFTIPKTTNPYREVYDTKEAHTKTLSTNSFFDTTNKTTRVLNVEGSFYVVLETGPASSGSSGIDSSYTGYRLTYTLGTVTLNAPPTVEVGTPTYNNPQYAGLGTYSLPITTATAYYGGDVTSIKLTIGSDSVTQTYSAQTVTNQTLTLTPTTAGTFTPQLIVTDSRTQTKTLNLPQITVKQHVAPSVSFSVFRSDENGIKADEGHNGLVTATFTYTDEIASLTEPYVEINGFPISDTIGTSITWYTALTQSGAVDTSTEIDGENITWADVAQNTPVYGLLDGDYDHTGNFSEGSSYLIGLQVTDTRGKASTLITQTLSTAFYTIDFQAGGKEIAFGAPANDDLTAHANGLFKCNMDAYFTGEETLTDNPYFSLDTSAQSGTTDGDLYAAITALGWQNDVIV